jgi:hydroxymethylbilane synthase
VTPIRGNVGTRLNKALAGADSDYDGAVLAAAGLERLGRIDSVAQFLDPEQFVPAVGQGALAIEIRAGDGRMRAIAESAGDSPTHLATSAERAFLRAMGGGCATPISAHAVIDGDVLAISGFAADPDATRVVRVRLEGSADDAEDLGRRLAGEILDAGGRELVETAAGG